MKKKPKELIYDEKIHKDDLPHLFGFPWYKWAWEFFHDKSKNAFLVAPNQVSKSSTLIRKTIYWATTPKLWPCLWKRKPTMFWYVYPSKEVATTEFKEKWVKEFLPRGSAEDHPLYGWESKMMYGHIHSIIFNSGVTIYFRTYSQDIKDVQTATVFFVGLDEETPMQYWPELSARRVGCEGYVNMVFTATIGQKFWYQVIERIGKPDEKLPTAFKRQVSLFDSQKYMDGSKSPWTNKRIKETIESYGSETEIQRRVYGKFVRAEGQFIEHFSEDKNFRDKDFDIPEGWVVYYSIFVSDTRKTVLVGLACSPERTGAVVFEAKTYMTTAADVCEDISSRHLRKSIIKFVNDDADDFLKVAHSLGVYFHPTRPHKSGLHYVLNSLFKTGILQISKSDECRELITQIETIKDSDLKDFKDYELYAALVMVLGEINFDFGNISKTSDIKYINMDERERFRRGLVERPYQDATEEEFIEFNDTLDA